MAAACLPSFGQKKEISVARDNIKKGVKLDEAEKSMNKLLQDSANRSNEKIWITLFEALKKEVEQDNEKLYLKQKTDTAQLFSTTLHIFLTLEGLDSLDSHKGTVKPSYRKKHADFLMKYAGNLYMGGVYYIRRCEYAKAFTYFDAYLQIQNQSLFSNSERLPEKMLQQAAYGALVCGYKLNDSEKVFCYDDIALRDNDKRVYVMQYLADTYLKEARMNEYRNTLEDGFREYPQNRYFFSRLMEYYEEQGDYEKVCLTSEKVLLQQPDDTQALLAKSTACLKLERYDEAIKSAVECLKIDPEQKKALLNAGLAYYAQAKPLIDKARLTKQEKAQREQLLKDAMPYLEQYREAMPDDDELWGKPLYDIYLYLNMGEKFDELDRILEN